MQIIDTRWMKNRKEFRALLGKIRRPQEGKAQVILFLTDNALEKSLGDSVTEFSKQNYKRGSANCCIAYELNSQRATVMDSSPLTNTRS